ncbi:MAG: cell envelope biogenesis protein OmpA, partial [Firmicutes bacterium]|nr:cell envelope biogenesis protein OmpA [Bacillota bacterium]
VFETAVRLFPEDEIANHNAAATAIMQNKPEQADILLDRSSRQTAEYLNNRGVVYLLKGAYEQAEPLFREAEKRGLPEARYNLEELARKKISEGLD